jgi:predicted nucleic acid-binding protein
MSKTFRDIPDQAAVMLDANIVVYALVAQARFHDPCARLLECGARRELNLHLVVHAAADIIHRVMVLEVLAQGTVQHSADAVRYLKKHPQAIQQLGRSKTVLRDLKRARVNILPLSYQDLHASRQYRESHGLMTNDSLIVAVMRRERMTILATNDSDFARVPDIAVRLPE